MISYQAVIRNSSNQLVANTTISMRINILHGTSIGASVYTETQTPITNANGLVTIKIGTGITSDNFSDINWADGPYFIKTETDPTGGTNYTISGTSQLLSVPYALHSKTADAVLGLNDTLANKAVLLTGDQIIAGNKTFTGSVHTNYIEVNSFGSGNRYAFIDFHGDDTYTDYSLRLIRYNTGANANSLLEHRGTGVMSIQASDSGSIRLATKGINRMSIDANGNILVNEQMRNYKTLRVYDPSNKTLFFRQDGTNSYISNKQDFLASGTPKNGWLHINGEGGIVLRVGSEGVAGTTVISIDTLKNINMQNNPVINVKTPVNANDAVNKAYVDSKVGPHYLGEEYLGGIIFYLYTDDTGVQKGLIVSKTQSTGTWSGSTIVNANRTEDGAYNTNLMPAGSTAKTWVTGLGAGWYIPSIDELSLLWHNRFHVNKTARAISSTLLSTTAYYWSSTEYDATIAFSFYFFSGGTAYNTNKTNDYFVRAIRAF
jgi:hypothetical protein